MRRPIQKKRRAIRVRMFLHQLHRARSVLICIVRHVIPQLMRRPITIPKIHSKWQRRGADVCASTCASLAIAPTSLLGLGVVVSAAAQQPEKRVETPTAGQVRGGTEAEMPEGDMGLSIIVGECAVCERVGEG